MKKILLSLILFGMPLFIIAQNVALTSSGTSIFTSVFFWVVITVLTAGIISIFQILSPLATLQELKAFQNKDQAAFEALRNNRSKRLARSYLLASIGSLLAIGVTGWNFYRTTFPPQPPAEPLAEVVTPAEPAVDTTTVVALTDEAAISIGKNIYNSNCAACHGPAGEGLVGPNLTDNYWIHGSGIKAVFKIIADGVPEKGMVSWSKTLKPDAIQKVASYILTLEGTNPPNAKAPEGQLISMSK